MITEQNTYSSSSETSIEKNKNSKLTYTIPEVSEILNISVSQAYKLANQNTLPTIRLGKRILVSVKKLEEFVNQ